MKRKSYRIAGLVAALVVTASLHAAIPATTRAERGGKFIPLPEVARALSFGFDAVLADFYWLWAVQTVGQRDADVARDVEGILVVEVEGTVVGYITTWQDTEAGIGYIPNLAFVPEWRGKGLGRRLIVEALDRFRAAGLSHAKIETLAQNEVGHHLYTSIGFQEVAQQVHFFADLSDSQGAGE